MGSVTSTADLATQAKSILAFPSAVPSAAVLPWISLQYYERATVYVAVANATTVTGSAVALEQAEDVQGTSSKTLAFADMYANEDTDTADHQALTTVLSNTFTTEATDNRNLLYQIEIEKTDLDTANDFETFRVTLGNAVAATVTVVVMLWPPVTAGVIPSAIVD